MTYPTSRAKHSPSTGEPLCAPRPGLPSLPPHPPTLAPSALPWLPPWDTRRGCGPRLHECPTAPEPLATHRTSSVARSPTPFRIEPHRRDAALHGPTASHREPAIHRETARERVVPSRPAHSSSPGCPTRERAVSSRPARSSSQGCPTRRTTTARRDADLDADRRGGKGGTKIHGKVLPDNIRGITTAILRLARRGGVKRKAGLVYEETSGVLKDVTALHRALATVGVRRLRREGLRHPRAAPPPGEAGCTSRAARAGNLLRSES